MINFNLSAVIGVWLLAMTVNADHTSKNNSTCNEVIII